MGSASGRQRINCNAQAIHQEIAVKRIATPVFLILGLVCTLLAEPGDKVPPTAAPASLTVENEQGKATTFSPEALGKLSRHRASVTGHSGTPATYEGVALADVLRAAKVT